MRSYAGYRINKSPVGTKHIITPDFSPMSKKTLDFILVTNRLK
jgi:hypothetical protein